MRGRPHRNNELLRAVGGISQKVLTETLRDFEVHGLIERRDYKTVPPKVDYRLTALGESLAEALGVIDRWVIDHFFAMAGARERYLRKKRRAAGATF